MEKPEVEPRADTPEKEKEKLMKEINKILSKNNGMESNISPHHEYWTLLNQYRGMP